MFWKVTACLPKNKKHVNIITETTSPLTNCKKYQKTTKQQHKTNTPQNNMIVQHILVQMAHLCSKHVLLTIAMSGINFVVFGCVYYQFVLLFDLGPK